MLLKCFRCEYFAMYVVVLISLKQNKNITLNNTNNSAFKRQDYNVWRCSDLGRIPLPLVRAVNMCKDRLVS